MLVGRQAINRHESGDSRQRGFPQTSNLKPQTSNLKPQTSNPIPQTPYLKPHTLPSA